MAHGVDIRDSSCTPSRHASLRMHAAGPSKLLAERLLGRDAVSSQASPACRQPHPDRASACAAQRLPLSIPELAEQSPTIAGNGAPVLSERRNELLYLDRSSGRLLAAFPAPATAAGSAEAGTSAHAPAFSVPAEADESGVAGAASLAGAAPRRVLAVGRVTYDVHARHPLTGEKLWSVLYSAWSHLPTPGVDADVAPLFDMATGALLFPCPGCCTLLLLRLRTSHRPPWQPKPKRARCLGQREAIWAGGGWLDVRNDTAAVQGCNGAMVQWLVQEHLAQRHVAARRRVAAAARQRPGAAPRRAARCAEQ